MFFRNTQSIADWFWPVLNLSQINNFISIVRVDAESVQLVDDGHVQGTLCPMVESVHDLRTQNITVQCTVEGLWHDTVEFFQYLTFDCSWHNLGDSSIKDILDCS